MCAFGCLYEEAQCAGLGVGSDCGVARVCQWAGLAVTKAREVILIAAEVLVFAGESGRG